jgi:ubiquinone/menaquinone biosynthesis C-methylase UbiE
MPRQRAIMFRGKGKLDKIGEVFSPYLRGMVLDVGCRDKYMAKWVAGKYVGIDVSGLPDVVADLEYRLPFRDASFDMVMALDVLEHLDRLHQAFAEICRLSRRYVIICLPNDYEWHFRLRVLFGNYLSSQFILPAEPPSDRHKWLISYRDAKNFIVNAGKRQGFEVIEEVLAYWDYRAFFPKLIKFLGKMIAPYGSNFFAYKYLALLERRT